MDLNSVDRHLIRNGLLTCILAVGLSGCATSGIVNIWRDPQYAASPMKNILVVAIKPDVAKRRLWEDAFANALRERGVTATPSYQLFPNELPDTNAISAAVRENSYDGCIVTVKLPSGSVTQEVPGYTSDSLVVRYNPWTNMYYSYYQMVYTPGYTETQTVLRHKIDVWNTTQNGMLVWTATSEALDLDSPKASNKHIIGEVIDDLVKRKVIPSKS